MADDNKFAGEEGGGSERDSNPSLGNIISFPLIFTYTLADGAGEELKQLKDFKALISEKTEPKSIKTLSRAIVALLLLLVILACEKILLSGC